MDNITVLTGKAIGKVRAAIRALDLGTLDQARDWFDWTGRLLAKQGDPRAARMFELRDRTVELHRQAFQRQASRRQAQAEMTVERMEEAARYPQPDDGRDPFEFRGGEKPWGQEVAAR